MREQLLTEFVPDEVCPLGHLGGAGNMYHHQSKDSALHIEVISLFAQIDRYGWFYVANLSYYTTQNIVFTDTNKASV